MSENGRNALQQMEISNLGQLLNLVTNETKVKIRTLEKLHKSLINNAYGIIFNRIYIYVYTTVLFRVLMVVSGTALFPGTNYDFFGAIVIFLLHFGYTKSKS